MALHSPDVKPSVWILFAAALAAQLAAALAAPAWSAEDGWVTIPGGRFVMGTDDGAADERPAHSVVLEPFLLARLPVTNAEFAAFLNTRGVADTQGRRHFDWDDGDARIRRRDGTFVADAGVEDHPVVEPSWLGALAYCRWRGARLPTEAEWERAARGTAGRPYPWGTAPPDRARARFGAGGVETAPVTAHPAGATPEGALDLAGNVHEWTSSLYRPYPWRADDGREDEAAVGERVTRGGAHDSPPEHLRAAWRGKGVSRGPRAGHHNIGFRCARDAR